MTATIVVIACLQALSGLLRIIAGNDNGVVASDIRSLANALSVASLITTIAAVAILAQMVGLAAITGACR